MTFVQMIIAFLIVYICIYALISRVCQSIEHCATARAFAKFRDAGVMIKMDDLNEKIEKEMEKHER